MSIAEQLNLVSVQAYLSAEKDSPVKHEYIGGVVYAMSGGRNQHNLIAGNVFGTLWSRLKGNHCRPFNSDTKIRIRLPGHVRFYYPDASVVCSQNPPEDVFQDAPSLVLEVLSESTKRVDLGEKKDAYLSIPSLDLYILAEQAAPAVVVFRRTENGFIREVWSDLDAVIPLPEFNTELPLAEIYDGVAFS